MAEGVFTGEYDTSAVANKEEFMPTGAKFEDTPVSLRIKKDIDASPLQRIPFSQYMNEALYGDGGYYSENVALGNRTEHDHFTTSPEASTDFAFPFAQTAFKTWEAMGKPETFDIVEMGAGRGVFAKAILDWVNGGMNTDKESGVQFAKAVRYRILERSNGLIAQQKQTLSKYENVSWAQGSASDLPLGKVNGMIVSNELPDAFPVERVKIVDGKQVQCYVSVQNGEWVEVWDTPDNEVLAYLDRNGITVPEGEEISVNVSAEKFQYAVDQALEKGIIVTVDYSTRYEDEKQVTTIRTYGQEGSENSDPYATKKIYSDVGNRDMTSNVNYDVLEQIAQRDSLTVFRMMQGDFVNRSGIGDLLKEEKEQCIDTMNWDRLVAYSRRMASYEELQGFDDFEVMVAAKGVELHSSIDISHDFSWDDVIVPAVRYFDQSLEVDGIYLLQDVNGIRVRKALTQESSRVVPIYIHEIDDGVILNDSGTLHDLTGETFKERCKKLFSTKDKWSKYLSDQLIMPLISLDESI
jgi:SAM-dependent MidA family methyltransferase